MDRRFFLQVSALTAASSLTGWRFAGAAPLPDAQGGYDAVVVGAGLGGLSCAAHLARNGFRTVLLEQYGVPGGYATSFERVADQGNFTCEVSLHASVLGSPGMRGMLEELGVWERLALVEHPHAWSSRFPGASLDVPAKGGLDGFERQLTALFPDEAKGLAGYFALWRGVMNETRELDKGLAPADRSRFPALFKNLWEIRDKTVGQLVDAHVRAPRLKAVLTQSCGYYGLPPSRLSAFYYLQPTGEYLEKGGAYIKGTSQALSNALAGAVTEAGGKVLYGARVDTILVDGGRAVGVKTADGREFRARSVVCNASAPQVFGKMLAAGDLPEKDRSRLDTYSPSPASFIVWLGLGRDITRQFPDPEVSFYASEDMEANYAAAMACDFENSGFALMVYDNLVPGFSPKGCTSLSLMACCGYEHWKGFEADYQAGRKEAYNAEKNRLTDVLIRLAEKRAIPGLSEMIVMRESATPLTNLRFTLNTAGAIYGYNQSVDNSFMTRLPNKTGVPGLYLASAWGNPGGGFGGVLLGGKRAFKDVSEELAKAGS